MSFGSCLTVNYQTNIVYIVVQWSARRTHIPWRLLGSASGKRGHVVQWSARRTRYRRMPVKGSRCFVVYETLPSLLSHCS